MMKAQLKFFFKTFFSILLIQLAIILSLGFFNIAFGLLSHKIYPEKYQLFINENYTSISNIQPKKYAFVIIKVNKEKNIQKEIFYTWLGDKWSNNIKTKEELFFPNLLIVIIISLLIGISLTFIGAYFKKIMVFFSKVNKKIKIANLRKKNKINILQWKLQLLGISFFLTTIIILTPIYFFYGFMIVPLPIDYMNLSELLDLIGNNKNYGLKSILIKDYSAIEIL